MLTSRRIYNEVNYLILAINAALTPVENKVPNISNLVKKKKQIMAQKLLKREESY